MRAAVLKACVLAIGLFALAGCSNLDEKGAAKVEDRGISGDEMKAMDDEAKSKGLADDSGFSGSSLDDPNSPLAVRVIYFDYDSTTIKPEFASAVEAHGAYLASHPDTKITLEGHADERGSRDYNLALAERRALAVRRQLVLIGASAAQIGTVSYGEERPVSDGHDEQSYSLNRRVEIIY